MLFEIKGARRDNGKEVCIQIDAESEGEASLIANNRGILVETCKLIETQEDDPSSETGILPIIQSSPDTDEIPLSDTKECPRCGETIKYNAKICRFCQHSFETARVVSSQTISSAITKLSTQEQQKFSNCGSSCFNFFICFIVSIVIFLAYGICSQLMASLSFRINYKLNPDTVEKIMNWFLIFTGSFVLVMGFYALIYLLTHFSLMLKVSIGKRILGFIGCIGLILELGCNVCGVLAMVAAGAFR